MPCSPSVLRNQEPILKVLKNCLPASAEIIEVGSGTAQHAYFFATQGGYRDWQCTERVEVLETAALWCREAGVKTPMELDVSQSPEGSKFLSQNYDGMFTANTLHIMPADHVEMLFAWASYLLKDEAKLLVYGPFNYDGKFTSESNAQFEQWLKARDPRSGIRDFEMVVETAKRHGFDLEKDHAMPANNRILQFRKKA